MWFFYGLLLKDYNIAVYKILHTTPSSYIYIYNIFNHVVEKLKLFSFFSLLSSGYEQFPNVLGFIFGIVQMVLYIVYRNAKKILEEPKLQELSDHIIDVVKLSTMVCPELNPVVLQANDVGNDIFIEDENLKEKIEEMKEVSLQV